MKAKGNVCIWDLGSCDHQVLRASAGILSRGKIYIQALLRVTLCGSWVANISICHPSALWRAEAAGMRVRSTSSGKLGNWNCCRTDEQLSLNLVNSSSCQVLNFGTWPGGRLISNVLYFSESANCVKKSPTGGLFWTTIWAPCWMAWKKVNCTETNLAGSLECARQRVWQQNYPVMYFYGSPKADKHAQQGFQLTLHQCLDEISCSWIL